MADPQETAERLEQERWTLSGAPATVAESMPKCKRTEGSCTGCRTFRTLGWQPSDDSQPIPSVASAASVGIEPSTRRGDVSAAATTPQVRRPQRRVPVRQPSLAVQTEQILHEQLINGELAPGDRLPPEHELARQFQVSRATIRSAITALVRRGLVVQRHGVGNFAAAGIGLTNDLACAVDLAELLQRHGTEIRDRVRRRVDQRRARLTWHTNSASTRVPPSSSRSNDSPPSATLVYVVNAIAVEHTR